jgi:hypothetical protein
MHRCRTAVDRGLCVVLTMTLGAALFAAEACMGSRSGTSDSAEGAGRRAAKADGNPAHVDDARTVFAPDKAVAGVDWFARFRGGGRPIRAE